MGAEPSIDLELFMYSSIGCIAISQKMSLCDKESTTCRHERKQDKSMHVPLNVKTRRDVTSEEWGLGLEDNGGDDGRCFFSFSRAGTWGEEGCFCSRSSQQKNTFHSVSIIICKQKTKGKAENAGKEKSLQYSKSFCSSTLVQRVATSLYEKQSEPLPSMIQYEHFSTLSRY